MPYDLQHPRPASFDEGRTAPPMLGECQRPASFELPSRSLQSQPRAASFDLARQSSGFDISTRLGLTLPNAANILTATDYAVGQARSGAHSGASEDSECQQPSFQQMATQQGVVPNPLPPLPPLSSNLQPMTTTLSASGQMSAFSAVEVPKLMIHSPIENRSPTRPLSPTHVLPADTNLLTVPSPSQESRLLTVQGDFRTSPELAHSPTAQSELLSSMTGMQSMLSLNAAQSTLFMNAWASQQRMLHPPDNPEAPGADDLQAMPFDMDAINPQLLHMLGQSFNFSSDMLVPGKSIVQEDVRNGGGRYQLVRKRGRSGVWNLFGQVYDTVTKARLPFVACYACKVLYTDTGGGTGNMTRHRCPIGASFRNIGRSTSAESSESVALPSSFESAAPVKAAGAQERRTLSTNLSTESMVTPTDIAETPPATKHPSEPSAKKERPDPASERERELLAEAVARAATIDLRPNTDFTSSGFYQLCERLLLLGRRFNQTAPSTFLPNAEMIAKARDSLLRCTLNEIICELRHPDSLITVSCELLHYQEECRVVWATKMGPGWVLKHYVLGVQPATTPEPDAVERTLDRFNLGASAVHSTLGLAQPLASCENLPDIGIVLNQVVRSTLSAEQIAFIGRLAELRQRFVDLGYVMPMAFPMKVCMSGIRGWYEETHTWQYQRDAVLRALRTEHEQLRAAICAVDWALSADLEAFLQPFHDSLISLSNEETPTLQLVVPEWSALEHECQIEADEEGRLSETLRGLKLTAVARLRAAAHLVQPMHRAATLLNPKYKPTLDTLLSDAERREAFELIREQCGLNVKHEHREASVSPNGEPVSRRQAFLSRLGTRTEYDELKSYNNHEFSAEETNDVIKFWSTIGASKFPKLTEFARRLLSIPATTPSSYIPPTANITVAELPTSLILRRAFDNEPVD